MPCDFMRDTFQHVYVHEKYVKLHWLEEFRKQHLSSVVNLKVTRQHQKVHKQLRDKKERLYGDKRCPTFQAQRSKHVFIYQTTVRISLKPDTSCYSIVLGVIKSI